MTDESVILVGVDGSWRASGALEWALQEADLQGSPLRVVHVVEERLRRTPYWEPAVVDEAASRMVEDVQEHLRSRAAGPDHGPSSESTPEIGHTVELAAGRAAVVLADLAEDLVVVGRRGAGSFSRLLIGSTSEAVSNQAPVPVVIVPDGWHAAGSQGPVVVGVEEAGDSAVAVDFAARAAAQRGVALHLVHVWELPDMYGWDGSDISQLGPDRTVEDVGRRIEGAAQQWRDRYPDVEIRAAVLEGHPVYGLLEAADSADAQLIVVGGRRHRPLMAALLGSVTRGVLHHATRPVAVVHDPRSA